MDGASKQVPASPSWEGTEVKVVVRFEPNALGPAEGLLEVTPSDGGAPYVVRLVGTCRRPQPQGPFDVVNNGARDVPVHNVCSVDQEYVFTVDHPAFNHQGQGQRHLQRQVQRPRRVGRGQRQAHRGMPGRARHAAVGLLPPGQGVRRRRRRRRRKAKNNKTKQNMEK